MSITSTTASNPQFIGREKILKLYKELFSRWYTEDKSFRDLIMSAILTKDSKILLVGPPESGKTTLVRLIAKALSAETTTKSAEIIYAKIIGAPEKTLQKVLISTNIVKLLTKGEEEFVVRPIVKARIKFINEINRFSKSVQDALLSLLEEKEIEYGGKTFKTPDYIAFADMNPYRGDIDRALKSRFHASAYVPLVPMKGSVRISSALLKDNYEDLVESMPKILSIDELETIWEDVKKVDVPRRILLFANMLIWSFRACIHDKSKLIPGFMRLACAQCEFANEICSQIMMIPGERSIISLLKLSKARAWFYGRTQVNYSDIIQLTPFVIAHRIELIPAVKSEYPNPWDWAKISTENIIRVKWFYHERNKRIYGPWIKALSITCKLLNCKLDSMLNDVLSIYYPDVLKSTDPWLALKYLRYLAYGELGGRGDLVLRQLYQLVKKEFEQESKEIIRKMEPIITRTTSQSNVDLNTLLNLLNKLERTLPEDSKYLRDMIMAKLEELTIRLSLLTPGIYDEVKNVLKKYNFDNKEIGNLLSGKIDKLENQYLIVTRKSNFIILRAKNSELAAQIRKIIGV